MSSWLQSFGASLDRSSDQPVKPPGDLRHAAADRPPLGESVSMAVQQLAIQSSYWLLPALAARMLGFDAATTASFLAISLLLVAVSMVVQMSTRGVLGSGYAVPYVPAPITLPIYLGAAASGMQLGAAGAAILLAFLVATLLVLAFPKVLQLLTTEICGVVIFAVGLGFLPFVLKSLDRITRGMEHPTAAFADPPVLVVGLLSLDRDSMALGIFVATLAILVLVGLVRWRFAPYGIIGATLAGSFAYMLTIGPDAASIEALHAAPWFALPVLTPPDFAQMSLGLFVTAFVAALCTVADQVGDLLVMQREQNANWSRPDLPPLRRGILAANLTSALSGMAGGMVAATGSAGIALSIATRSFTRSVIFICALLVAVIAACPKITALLLTVPDTVVAAMLLFLGGWMMCSGLKLITARVMDARRTSCVGIGLGAGMATVIAPDLMVRLLPQALVTPVALSFLVAFGLHVITLPFVRRVALTDIPLDAGVGHHADAFIEQAAGNWALRRQTAEAMGHALLEIGELLAGRGVRSLRVRAQAMDGHVQMNIEHAGPVLPAPSARPDAADLESETAHEAFAMWMATREASECLLGGNRQQAFVRLSFVD